MPIIDLDPVPLDAVTARPEEKPKFVTPGIEDINGGSDAVTERPAWSSTLSAAFGEGNMTLNYFADEERNAPTYVEPDFNAWDSIKGTKYEPMWDSFVDVRNSRHAEIAKQKIDREMEDRKILSEAPLWQSIPAQMIAGVIDLPTLIPGGAFIRGAKGGFSIARSALSVGLAAGLASGVQEAALQGLQETRTAEESAINIGASVLLGGLLGAGGAAALGHAGWRKAVEAIDGDLARTASLAAGSPSSAGAAVVGPATLAENSIAGKAASVVAKSTARLNPILRILQSPSAEARDIGTKLFENSIYMKKNFDGVASEPAVETLMKEWNAGLGQAIENTNGLYQEFKKTSNGMSRTEFHEAIGKAMRRGDVSDNPAVQKAAQEWRAKVFDPLKDAAIKAGLLPEDVSVETAQSYLSRMWNRNRLIAREGEFKNIVVNWVEEQAPRWADDFDKETIAKAAKLKGDDLKDYQITRRVERDSRFADAAAMREMAQDIAKEVFDTLTGKLETGPRPEFITVKARGPLKERTFNIPDYLVEDFLESDVELIGRRYTRVMGADVEMKNKFGSVDLAEQVQKIRDEYARLRSGITDEKQLARLSKAEKKDVEDIEAVRDLLRGVYKKTEPETNYGRIVRALSHVNYLRSMGEVVLASLPDAVRPAMVHGLSQYMGTVGKLATNLKGIKLSVNEARLAGNVSESVLGHRLATVSDIMDPYASRGPTETFLENMTNIASKWNGIRMWTDMMKSVASVMTQDRILGNVANFGKINAREKSYLAYLGIGPDMAERIGKQFATHGETVDGVRVANTEKWTDAPAVRTYRAAMNKDVDSIIVQKSVADVPLFASTPTGRAMLQFKSFALSSHQRVLIRGLQEGQARFVGGFAAMTMMGMFIAYMKGWSGNRPEIRERMLSNPGWWIGEGIDKSGVLAVPTELANIFEKASGVNPIKSPFRAMDDTELISQKLQNRNLTGTLAGPTGGVIEDLATVIGIPYSQSQWNDLTKGQKNSIERLFPFNSYYGLRQMIRYVVNPPD